MKAAKNHKVSFEISSCCVCGMSNCDQSVDHQKVQLNQLKQIISQCKNNIPQIQTFKNQVRTRLYQLKNKMLLTIRSQQNEIISWLNSFYFKHLDKSIKNIAIFSDILQNNFCKLPNRQISKTFKLLKRHKQSSSQENSLINSAIEDFNQILKKIQVSSIIYKFEKQFNFDHVIKLKENNKLSKSVRSTKSQSTAPPSSQKKIEPALQTYEWKYVRFTKNTKTVDLNNRNITDEDMIKQLPIISTFSNIKQFQIRNNKITALTCNIIANDMKFLTVLDLRGNKIGDSGVTKLIYGIPNLKSLFVSETGITNLTGNAIIQNLNQLQTLWSQHTKLTGQVCIKLCQKPKLRLLSLLGNPITQEHKQSIRIIFRAKGYLNI